MAGLKRAVKAYVDKHPLQNLMRKAKQAESDLHEKVYITN